jgi:CobQ-like glutamine amidotransferase family enzyme
MQLRIGHIYPAQMNIYGDRGNIIALQQRCAWRNVANDVTAIQPGMQVDWAAYDICFFGGIKDEKTS